MPKIILKVWHGTKHDDSTVTVIFPEGEGAIKWVAKAKADGGFWTQDPPLSFVPWHRINYIEVGDE